MATEFYEFIEGLSIEAERAIKAELSRRAFLERVGFGLFMPLTINIITDAGSASLVFLDDGSVQWRKNLSTNPNNIIQADFGTLKELYSSRNKNQFIRVEREGKIKITNNDLKGQQAERKIRELLGS